MVSCQASTNLLTQSSIFATLLDRCGYSDALAMYNERCVALLYYDYRRAIDNSDIREGKSPDQKKRSLEAWFSVYLRLVYRDLIVITSCSVLCPAAAVSRSVLFKSEVEAAS